MAPKFFLVLFVLELVLFRYRVSFVQVSFMNPDIYFNPTFSLHCNLSVV